MEGHQSPFVLHFHMGRAPDRPGPELSIENNAVLHLVYRVEGGWEEPSVHKPVYASSSDDKALRLPLAPGIGMGMWPSSIPLAMCHFAHTSRHTFLHTHHSLHSLT